MSHVRFLTLILVFVGAHSQASAHKICSRDMYQRADASLSSVAGNWASLLKHHKIFAPCDDGALAEGYSSAVVTLFARRWDQLGVFVALTRGQSAFRRWAILHIDATASDEDLKKVAHNAAGCRGDMKTKSVCKEIGRAAANALTEQK